MGGLHPPNAFFCTVQALFQEHCIISKTCFARIIVIGLFKYHRAGSLFANGAAFPPTPGLAKAEAICTFSTPHVYLQMGGLRLPQPPRFFKLCKKTSSIILPAKTEPIWTGSEPVMQILRLQMAGGGLRPPNPLAFFLRRAGLLSKTSHHQHDLLPEHHCSRAFQTHHAGSQFAKGGYVRPNPRTSLSCTRPLQVSSCQQKQNPYGPFQNV